MFLGCLLSFFKSGRQSTIREDVWPEIELFEVEKKKFAKVRTNYNMLMQELMESSDTRLNQLSVKYHKEAFQIIYIGTTRCHEHDELTEQRHALTQILERIQEEASHIT